MEIGLYVHIPFCTGPKCRYCDFYSISFAAQPAKRYVQAVGKEWRLKRDAFGLSNVTLRTIYIGGGTPSILTEALWVELASQLTKEISLSPDLEWSIECNPDSFTREKAKLWLQSGVTRLSLGVQSLQDRELRLLGRAHAADQALWVLAQPVLADFRSVSADIMYGLPGQSPDSLHSTLTQTLAHPVLDHLSAYELAINESTPFGRHREILPLPDEQALVREQQKITAACAQYGFERYEVSNYAKPNRQCRHNEAYWNHLPYVGLGPSAHSYIHPRRTGNLKGLEEYLAAVESGLVPHDLDEKLTNEQLGSEIVFLRLRTSKGLDEREFEERTGVPFAHGARKVELHNMLEAQLLTHEGPFWRPTSKGLMMADGIARRLGWGV